MWQLYGQTWKVLKYTKEFRLYFIANMDPLRILAQGSDTGKVVFGTSQKTTKFRNIRPGWWRKERKMAGSSSRLNMDR